MTYTIYFIECIFLILLTVAALVKNILALRTALIFRRDFNNRNIIKAKAVITRLRRSVNSRGCTASARAKYVIRGDRILGKMICRFDDRLKRGQDVNIIADGTKRDIFAVDCGLFPAEQQVKNAVLTYSVFCVLSLTLVIGAVILSIWAFPKLI